MMSKLDLIGYVTKRVLIGATITILICSFPIL